MTVVLPAIQFAAETVEELAPGDTLNLEQSGESLWSAFPSVSLVTTSGWTLGPAQIQANTDSTLTVMPGNLQPRVHTVAAAAEGMQSIVVSAGLRKLSRGDLGAWDANAAITLELCAGQVQVHRSGHPAMDAVPVASGSKLGIRLVKHS